MERPKVEKFDASGKKVGIVVSRFNQEITDRIKDSAIEELKEYKVSDFEVVSIPGAVELPIALNRLALRNEFDCLIAIGCIIEGGTKHFDYVAKTAQEGCLRVSLDHNIPIGFGVLTLNNIDQAESRISIGSEAVIAALEASNIV